MLGGGDLFYLFYFHFFIYSWLVLALHLTVRHCKSIPYLTGDCRRRVFKLLQLILKPVLHHARNKRDQQDVDKNVGFVAILLETFF